MRDAQRAQAIGRIGAMTEIEDVVGEVGADLDQQRHQKRWNEHGQIELMQAVQGRASPDEYGHDCRRQGGGPGSEQPDAQTGRRNDHRSSHQAGRRRCGADAEGTEARGRCATEVQGE